MPPIRDCAGEGRDVVPSEKIVAVGLLTESNVRTLGSSLKKVFPITDDGRFDDLLSALDQAQRARSH